MEVKSPCEICYIYRDHGYLPQCKDTCDYAVKCFENEALKKRIKELETANEQPPLV